MIMLIMTKVSWEALREALALLERPSTVEEITDATWKVTCGKHCKMATPGLSRPAQVHPPQKLIDLASWEFVRTS